MIDTYLIKQYADINTVLSIYGISPNRAGFIHCIAHQDKTPSMKVYPKTNSVHCFACGADFDAIGLVMHLENCTFGEACEKLNAIFNLKTNYVPKVKKIYKPKNNFFKKEYFYYCNVLYDLRKKYNNILLKKDFYSNENLIDEAMKIGFQISKINDILDNIDILL